MASPSARFVINFDADTSGIDRSKSALDGLQASITADTAALKEMSDAMGRLKGTAEVIRWEALPRDIAKAESEVAKFAAQMAKLKTDFDKAPADKKEGIFAKGLQTQGELDKATSRLAALRGERDKLAKTQPVRLFEDLKAGAEKLKQGLGKSQTELSRMGGTMSKGAGEAGKAAAAMKDLAAGAEAAGAPTSGLVSTFKAFKALGPAGIVAAVVAVVVLLTVALAAGVAAGAGFAISMADAARSTRLLREAAAGSAQAAEGLYGATLRVEGKTSAQRETIAELANEYARLKLSLGGVEGATTAITIATQTMGSQVGTTIKGLIDRGMVAKRFWLNPLDLRGTGIAIRDVAAQLGKQMKIGVGAAETALRQGVVKIDDGVKALGAAFEASPLGAIAKKQALAIGVQFERAKSNIGRLFSGVAIEPFLEKLSEVLELFNETSEAGKAIKGALTAAFQPLIDSATASLPLVEEMVWRGVIAIQDMVIAFLEAGGAEGVFKAVKSGAEDLLTTLKAIAKTVEATASAYNAFQDAVTVTATNDELAELNARLAVDKQLGEQGKDLGGILTANGTSAGADLAAGIAAGIKEGTPEAIRAIAALADAMKVEFAKKNEMHSPSVLYRRDARNIPRGAALGVEDDTPLVARALSKMANPDAFDSDGSVTSIKTSTSSEDRSVNLTVNYYGSGTRGDARRFSRWLTDDLETATLAKGLKA